MSHFSEQTWADFVRDIDTTGATPGWEAHLASDCIECKSAFDLWGRVGRLAAKERDYAPPDNLVRLVKLAFPAAEAPERRNWPIASLLFDSTSAPLAVGIRGAVASTRQLVYEGEGLTVDIRFERRQHSNSIRASGQVLDKHVPLRWLGKAAIVLWNDRG